jgi:hypothetical protein
MPRRVKQTAAPIRQPFTLSAADYAAMISGDDLAVIGESENPAKKPRKKRTKAEQLVNPYEWQFQGRLVKRLELELPRDYVVQSVVAEGKSRLAQIRARQQGQKPGYPEVWIHGDGRSWTIECKAKGGRFTQSQIDMHPRIIAAGIPLLRWCETEEQAIDFLTLNGARFR